MKAIICLLAGVLLVRPQIVAFVDFTTEVIQTNSYLYSNAIGLSMRFDEMIPQFNDTLFQGYLLNSNVYGDWYCIFDQAIHMPIGYKYNCTTVSAMTNGTSTCTIDLSTNSSLMGNIANYLWDTTMSYGTSLGWDMQGANFSNTQYLHNFVNFVMDIYYQIYQPFNIELVDKGDQYAAMGLNPNYTGSQMVDDCTSISNVVYGLVINGPGITDAADASWYESIQDIVNYCGYFTARAIVFQNTSLLTIANLLSEQYTQQYLLNRFTVNGNNYFTAFAMGINDMRLVAADNGIDGLTNSFAAAIWAIEMSMEFAIMGGIRMDFFNPVANASYQSVIGQAPLYNPSSLYYALLFTIIANKNSPFIERPTITAGSSASIQSYGLNQDTSYAFILLNKDMNQNLAGKVQIALSYPSGINCLYLSAAHLNSTSGITFAGLSFGANNSHYVGDYNAISYYPEPDGYYYVDIQYAQAVYCYSMTGFTATDFPTDPNPNGELFTYASLFISLIAMILLY